MNNEDLEDGAILQVTTKTQNREAVQWLNTTDEFSDEKRHLILKYWHNTWEGFLEKSKIHLVDGVEKMSVLTNNGWVNANDGDFIIKTKCGEFYPCSEKTFRESYDVVVAKDDTTE